MEFYKNCRLTACWEAFCSEIIILEEERHPKPNLVTAYRTHNRIKP